MTKTKKNVSRTSKIKKTIKKIKTKSKTKSKTKTKRTNTITNQNFTARIIIKDNVGGIVADKDSIKEILESIGAKVEVIIYNDIKNAIKNNDYSKLKFKSTNIQIFIEHIFLEHPLEIFPSNKSYIFVNQEYIQDWDIDRMLDKTVTPLCKTQESLKTLNKLGIKNAKYVGFGNKREFKYIDRIDKIPNLFIHIVGGSPMKGTKTLIDTWLTKKIKEPLIITANNKSGGNTNLFKYWQSLKPKAKPLPDVVLNKWKEWKKIANVNNSNSKDTKLPKFETIESSSVYFCNTVLDYNVIQFLQTVAAVHMCPSLIEGWGQYIDEGRRAKAVVLTLDAPPMNELVNDGDSGILVNAYKGPTMRHLLPYGWIQYFTKNKDYNTYLYGTYKTSINDLYTSINRILSMSLESKIQLGENAFNQSRKDYEQFKNNFIKAVLDSIDSIDSFNSNTITNKIDNETKYDSRNKTKNLTKKNIPINKQKTLRIIFEHSPSLVNDATIYKNEFLKQGYKVDFKLIETVHNKNKESYYDINLILETLPFKCKNIFPSKTNLFMPNNELFIDTKEDNKKYSKKDKYGKTYTYDRYEELKSIDFILCKTEICHKFFNFIKNEKYRNNMYKYQTIYTKFTSTINDKIKDIVDSNNYDKKVIDPNLFVHLAGKSPFKNTPDLVHCWIKNKGFLNIDPDIKLVVTCYEHCSFWFNKTLIKHYKYDFEKDPDVNMNYKTNIATYKNMKIYFKPVNPYSDFINIITKANVAICISNKEGYGHYINEVRYMKKFIITLDYPPMNELVIDKDGIGGNGIVLKKKNKFIKKTYKETNFNFSESYPYIDELRDSIIWCIKHKHELRKYGENGRKMFLDDKQYFEDVMEKFIENKL